MDDDLWALIEPLLPPRPERSPGPKPVDDRLCLQGILYVLNQNIAWQLQPLELEFGSGQPCWRSLDRRQKAGVFERLHWSLLSALKAACELDWTRACVDGSHVRAGVPPSHLYQRPLAPTAIRHCPMRQTNHHRRVVGDPRRRATHRPSGQPRRHPHAPRLSSARR